MAYERSEHEKKYDRQMRLWGSHGQMNLETAHICCLGSGATASEALKNLVLPNVGRFTLVDDAVTTAADKNNNFFVDVHSIGRPRAEVVTELLLEMNEEVKGSALVKSTREMLASSDLSFFKQFALVLVSDPTLAVRDVLPLASYLWAANIPLVLVQCKGFLGSVRLQVREHAIIESHPGNDRYDLYVHPEQSKRWPELQQYFNQFKVFKSDFEQPAAAAAAADAAPAAAQPDGEEHAHIPYVAILAHCIARWVSEHEGALPRSYDEKKALKAFVRSTAWSAEEGNFDEAIEFAHRAYDLPRFDRYVQAVFDDPAADDEATLRTSNFWLLVRSVRDFIAKEGGGVCYPVSQNLPDMHCKTAYYVQLKQLFQARAEADLAAVRQHLHARLTELGQPTTRISEHELGMFVRNVRTLRVIRTRSLAQEYGAGDAATKVPEFNAEAVREIIEEEQEMLEAEDEAEEEEDDGDEDMEQAPPQRRLPNNVHWYLALRAADVFLATQGRAAGTSAKGPSAPVSIPELEADFGTLQGIATQLLGTLGLSDVLDAPNAPTLGEVVRSGATEPHVTAAFLGGLAAQLGLKLLLKQYVPLNHTVLWNGLAASSTSYQL